MIGNIYTMEIDFRIFIENQIDIHSAKAVYESNTFLLLAQSPALCRTDAVRSGHVTPQ